MGDEPIAPASARSQASVAQLEAGMTARFDILDEAVARLDERLRHRPEARQARSCSGPPRRGYALSSWPFGTLSPEKQMRADGDRLDDRRRQWSALAALRHGPPGRGRGSWSRSRCSKGARTFDPFPAFCASLCDWIRRTPVRSPVGSINRNFRGFHGFFAAHTILAAGLLDLFLLSDLFGLFEHWLMLRIRIRVESPTREMAITPCSPKAEKPKKPEKGNCSLVHGA